MSGPVVRERECGGVFRVIGDDTRTARLCHSDLLRGPIQGLGGPAPCCCGLATKQDICTLPSQPILICLSVEDSRAGSSSHGGSTVPWPHDARIGKPRTGIEFGKTGQFDPLPASFRPKSQWDARFLRCIQYPFASSFHVGRGCRAVRFDAPKGLSRHSLDQVSVLRGDCELPAAVSVPQRLVHAFDGEVDRVAQGIRHNAAAFRDHRQLRQFTSRLAVSADAHAHRCVAGVRIGQLALNFGPNVF